MWFNCFPCTLSTLASLMFKALSNPRVYYFITELLWAIISLVGASGMNICPRLIPALWRHSPTIHTMDNNSIFMEAEDGCEVFSLYMAGIPGTSIHLQTSKVSPRWLLRSIKLWAVTWRLSVGRSGTHRGTHHHGKIVLLLLHCLLLLHLFSSSPLFSRASRRRDLRKYPGYIEQFNVM